MRRFPIRGIAQITESPPNHCSSDEPISSHTFEIFTSARSKPWHDHLKGKLPSSRGHRAGSVLVSPSVWLPMAPMSQSPGKAVAIQADAANPEAAASAVEKTVASLGRLDILVNNAGTAIPKRFEDSTVEDLNRVIDLNLRGVMFATKAALKHMNPGGRIIMIGSCVGERMMTPGLVSYSATKGAVKMFTQGLSREVGDRGITVNNIQPGPIDTDLNPASGDWAAPQKAVTALNRYGTVDEVAAAAAFLASPEASYITGASLTVDGGTNA